MVPLPDTLRHAITPVRLVAAIAMAASASGGYVIASAPMDAVLTLASASTGAALEVRCDADPIVDRHSLALPAKESPVIGTEPSRTVTHRAETGAAQSRSR
jgi:hypothetical protein